MLIQDLTVRRFGQLVYHDRFCWCGPWDRDTAEWHFGGQPACGSLYITGSPNLEPLDSSENITCFPTAAGDLCLRCTGSSEAVTSAVVHLALQALDLGGLEGFLGLPDSADRADSGMPATNQCRSSWPQRNCSCPCPPGPGAASAVGWPHVEDGDLGFDHRLPDDLEELALAVGLYVQGNDACRASAASRSISDLQPSADAGKLAVEQGGIQKAGHDATGRVHKESAHRMSATVGWAGGR